MNKKNLLKLLLLPAALLAMTGCGGQTSSTTVPPTTDGGSTSTVPPTTDGGPTSSVPPTSTVPPTTTVPPTSENELITAKNLAKEAIAGELAKLVEGDYSIENWKAISKIVTDANAAILEATSLTDIETIKTKAIKDMADVQTIAQESAAKLAAAIKAAKDEITAELAKYVRANYSEEKWTELNNIAQTAIQNISAAKTIEEIAPIKTKAISDLSLVESIFKTHYDEIKDTLTNAVTVDFKKDNYSEANWATITSIFETALSKIDTCKSITELDTLSSKAFADARAVTTLAQEAEKALNEKKVSAKNELKQSYVETDYSLEHLKEVKAIVSKAETDINNAGTIKDVETILANAKTKVNEIVKLDRDTFINKAKEELAKYQQDDYYAFKEGDKNDFADLKSLFDFAIAEIKKSIDDTKYQDLVDDAIAGAKLVLTKAQYDAKELADLKEQSKKDLTAAKNAINKQDYVLIGIEKDDESRYIAIMKIYQDGIDGIDSLTSIEAVKEHVEKVNAEANKIEKVNVALANKQVEFMGYIDDAVSPGEGKGYDFYDEAALKEKYYDEQIAEIKKIILDAKKAILACESVVKLTELGDKSADVLAACKAVLSKITVDANKAKAVAKAKLDEIFMEDHYDADGITNIDAVYTKPGALAAIKDDMLRRVNGKNTAEAVNAMLQEVLAELAENGKYSYVTINNLQNSKLAQIEREYNTLVDTGEYDEIGLSELLTIKDKYYDIVKAYKISESWASITTTVETYVAELGDVNTKVENDALPFAEFKANRLALLLAKYNKLKESNLYYDLELTTAYSDTKDLLDAAVEADGKEAVASTYQDGITAMEKTLKSTLNGIEYKKLSDQILGYLGKDGSGVDESKLNLIDKGIEFEEKAKAVTKDTLTEYISAITEIYNGYIAEFDKIETKLMTAKIEAQAEMDKYIEEDYSGDNWAILLGYKTTLKTAIDDEKATVASINEAKETFITNSSAVKTLLVETQEAAVTALNADADLYKDTRMLSTHRVIFNKYYSDAITSINGSSSLTEIAQLKDKAITDAKAYRESEDVDITTDKKMFDRYFKVGVSTSGVDAYLEGKYVGSEQNGKYTNMIFQNGNQKFVVFGSGTFTIGKSYSIEGFAKTYNQLFEIQVKDATKVVELTKDIEVNDVTYNFMEISKEQYSRYPYALVDLPNVTFTASGSNITFTNKLNEEVTIGVVGVDNLVGNNYNISKFKYMYLNGVFTLNFVEGTSSIELTNSAKISDSLDKVKDLFTESIYEDTLLPTEGVTYKEVKFAWTSVTGYNGVKIQDGKLVITELPAAVTKVTVYGTATIEGSDPVAVEYEVTIEAADAVNAKKIAEQIATKLNAKEFDAQPLDTDFPYTETLATNPEVSCNIKYSTRDGETINEYLDFGAEGNVLTYKKPTAIEGDKVIPVLITATTADGKFSSTKTVSVKLIALAPEITELFISEIGEAAGSNMKWIEIYNGTNQDVVFDDLENDYKVNMNMGTSTNNIGSPSIIDLVGTVPALGTFVLYSSSLSSAEADYKTKLNSIPETNKMGYNFDGYNGDISDYFTFLKGETVIDSGVETIKNKVYTRKPEVFAPTGTFNENEWEIVTSSTSNYGFDDLGNHFATYAKITDDVKVAKEKAALSLKQTNDLVDLQSYVDAALPVAGTNYTDVTITWSSSNENVVVTADNKLELKQQNADQTGTLTATLTIGDITDTKVFNYTLAGHGIGTKIDAALSAMEFGGDIASGTEVTLPATLSTTLDTAAEDLELTWFNSANEVITSSITLTGNAGEKATIKVKAKRSGDTTEGAWGQTEKVFEYVFVDNTTKKVKDAAQLAIETALDPNTALTESSTATLPLSVEVDGKTYAISYASDNEDALLISDGEIVVAQAAEEKIVTVTATIDQGIGTIDIKYTIAKLPSKDPVLVDNSLTTVNVGNWTLTNNTDYCGVKFANKGTGADGVTGILEVSQENNAGSKFIFNISAFHNGAVKPSLTVTLLDIDGQAIGTATVTIVGKGTSSAVTKPIDEFTIISTGIVKKIKVSTDSPKNCITEINIKLA